MGDLHAVAQQAGRPAPVFDGIAGKLILESRCLVVFVAVASAHKWKDNTGPVCQQCPNEVVIAVHWYDPLPTFIEDLQADVMDLALTQSVENQLLETLNTALIKFTNPKNLSDGVKTLKNFIAIVKNNKGMEISETGANALIAAAQAILARLKLYR